MKILFIQLPVQDPNWESARANIPLAAGYLAAYAESRGLLSREDWSLLDRRVQDLGSDSAIVEAIATEKPDQEEALRAMGQSERVRSSSRLLGLMAENPAAKPARPQLTRWLRAAEETEAEKVARIFLERHADEVKREDAQPFQLAAAFEGEDDPLQQLLARVAQGLTVAAPEEQEHLSILQKIGRMGVGERIKLAVRGNREERMVLIRDRSKLVSLAVLESPKVNDAEMETFAAMKNVQETVLRSISTKRNYMKNYGVLRALVSNPKTPLDVALPLLAHLLVKDLRSLAVNKNVNETVRKLGLKMFRAKTERKKA